MTCLRPLFDRCLEMIALGDPVQRSPQCSPYGRARGTAFVEHAQQQQFSCLKVFSDSELLVKQMNGEYKVRHPALQKLYEQAQRLARPFQHFSIHHVLRRYNLDADLLVNQVLDSQAKNRL